MKRCWLSSRVVTGDAALFQSFSRARRAGSDRARSGWRGLALFVGLAAACTSSFRLDSAAGCSFSDSELSNPTAVTACESFGSGGSSVPVEVFYLETDDSGRYVVGLIAASDVDSVSGPQVRDTNMDGTSALVEVFADGALAFDISLADHGRWTCALAFQPAGTSPECERAE